MTTTPRLRKALPIRRIAGLMAVLLVPIAAPGAVAGAVVHTPEASLPVIASNVAFPSGQKLATPATIVGTPPGRVLQNVGISGYSLNGNSATRSISTTFALPSVNGCGTNGTQGWQSAITGSQPTYGLTFGFAGIWMNFSCNSGFGVYSSVYAGCGGLGTNHPQCPLFGVPSGTSGGDAITLTLTTDGAGDATTTWADLNSGKSMINTNIALYAANSPVNILEEDYCDIDFAPATTPCVNVDPNQNSSLIPPFFANYNPIVVASTTIDGQSLASAVTDTSKYSNTYQVNSVYGSTLLDETSAPSGGAFTITDADRTLPSASVSATSVDASATQNQTMQFTVRLSQSETNPAYVDYVTHDDGAVSGINYIGTDGTLFFPPGSTSQTVNVTILPSESTGGQLGVGFSIANPSYLALASGGAVGTIYLGPNVSSVTPKAIPTDAQEALVVQGNDFGAAGSRDTVEFCNDAGTCDPGAAAKVISDNEIDVTSPNASNMMEGGSSLEPADTYVSNAKGIQSPQVGGDVVVFGCQQVVNNDGAYTYAGCVYPNPTQPNAETTEQKSNVDGVQVSASRTNTVSYAPGSVTSTGSVQMTLDIAGQTVTLFSGPVSDSLSGPLQFQPTGAVAGFTVAGPLTLTPIGNGSATGQMAVKLPSWLGGGSGQMTFKTVVNGATVLALRVTANGAGSFANLVPFSNLVFNYGGGIWTFQANVGSATGPVVTGTAVYAPGAAGTKPALQHASISFPPLQIFNNVISVNGLTLNWDPATNWTGGGSAGQPVNGTGGVVASLTMSGAGDITAGSIVVNNGYALGAVPTTSLSLTLAAGAWTVSTTLPAGGSAAFAGSVTVKDGVVQSGSISLKKLPLFDDFLQLTGKVTYSLSANGPLWVGTVGVKIPEEAQGSGTAGFELAISVLNGVPASANLTLSNTSGVPLADGVLVTQLGIGVQWYPNFGITYGSVGVGIGPPEGAGPLIGVTGTISRENNPPVGTPAFTQFAGTLSVLKAEWGTATAKLFDDGTSSIELTIGNAETGFTPIGGGINIKGSVKGTFGAGKAFDMKGQITLTDEFFGPKTLLLHVNANGMAACTTNGAGFEWIYTGTPTAFKTGCSTLGF